MEKPMLPVSVGAVVRKGDKFLVQYRLRNPIGLAFPAGHVDPGEVPKKASIRELDEETGLRTLNQREVLHVVIPTSCAKGHTEHEWFVYELEFGVDTEGVPELKEPTKHKFAKWMTIEEMGPYIERGECDPAWFQHILPALGIL